MTKPLIPVLEYGKHIFINTKEDLYSLFIFQIVKEKIELPKQLLFCIWFIALSHQLIPKISFSKTMKKNQVFKKIWNAEKIIRTKIKGYQFMTIEEFLNKINSHQNGTTIIFLNKKYHILYSGILLCRDPNQLYFVMRDDTSYVKISPFEILCRKFSHYKLLSISSGEIISLLN